jgi:hypothetical protein
MFSPCRLGFSVYILFLFGSWNFHFMHVLLFQIDAFCHYDFPGTFMRSHEFVLNRFVSASKAVRIFINIVSVKLESLWGCILTYNPDPRP